MSLSQDHLGGRFSQALARWADKLAVGVSWEEVEAEIVTCCHGRVDLLTQLLVHAETRTILTRPAARSVAGQVTGEDARRDDSAGGSRDRRVLHLTAWRPVDAAVWYLPQ